MKALELRLFRFDVSKDYESYFKPYIYPEPDNFFSLFDLFLQIREDDPYFAFEEDEGGWVLVNGHPRQLREPLSPLLAEFGHELKIAPLSERRSRQDFVLDREDFLAQLAPLRPLITAEDEVIYRGLDHLYYTSPVLPFCPEYLGDSMLVFAEKMMKKYPQKRRAFLEFLAGAGGVFYFLPGPDAGLNALAGRLQDESLKLGLFDKKLLNPHKPSPAPATPAGQIKHDFAGFAVSTFRLDPRTLRGSFAAKFSPLTQKISGFELLKINEDLALRIAAGAVFEAYDGGADFLLVGCEDDFALFDGWAKGIQAASGRGLEGFYILRLAEFYELARGGWPASLKDHVLEVLL